MEMTFFSNGNGSFLEILRWVNPVANDGSLPFLGDLAFLEGVE